MTATMNASWGESALSLASGFVVAVMLQRLTGWWLNSGVGVATTLAGVFIVSSIVGAMGAPGRRERLRWLWCGVNAGLTFELWRTGPGTIWPIVLVIGGGLTAVAAIVGSFAGGAIRR